MAMKRGLGRGLDVMIPDNHTGTTKKSSRTTKKMCIRDSCYIVLLSFDTQTVWRGDFRVGILCYFRIFSVGMRESGNRCIYVCGDREPGNRGGAYVFSVVCLPCDRRNFFLFFRNSIYLLCGFCRGVGCPYMGIVYDDS